MNTIIMEVTGQEETPVDVFQKLSNNRILYR
jgi:hypothetical protein